MQIRTTTMPAPPRMSKSRQQRTCMGTGHTRTSAELEPLCHTQYAPPLGHGRGVWLVLVRDSMVGRHSFTGHGLGVKQSRVRRSAITREAQCNHACRPTISGSTSAGTRERDGSAVVGTPAQSRAQGLGGKPREPGFDVSRERSEPWFSAEVEWFLDVRLL